MDPMIFATIVSQLAIFVAERRAQRDKTTADAEVTAQHFQEWLRRSEHQSVVALLRENSRLTETIKELLNDQHEDLLERLRGLDTLLASVARHIAGFGELAGAAVPEAVISDQAIGILQQLDTAEAQYLQAAPTARSVEPHYLMVGGNSRNFEIQDPRFLKDDLDVLCELGLLTFDPTSQGTARFRLTRTGSQLARSSRE